MKSTSYSFGAQIFRYQGIYLACCIFIIIAFLPIIQPDYTGAKIHFIALALLFILWGIINLWLQPMVKIDNDGLLIKRLGVIERKVKWNNFKLFKKVRTVTRFSLIGLDPRYLVVEIKDGLFFDKRISILSFFKGYDEFASEIERNLNSIDIITDKDYKA